MKTHCSDAEFMELFETYGGDETSRKLRCSVRAVYSRRRRLEARNATTINSPRRFSEAHPARLQFQMSDGYVLVGSDAHIWPGVPTTAMRAFIKFAKELKPKVLVLNGDVMDFPQVSRHPPIGWEQQPKVADEIAAANEILKQIEDAVPRNCKLVWTLGNHDSRFETRIASHAPELAKVKGVHLKDHFSPRWQPCWSAWVNDLVIKHRFKGGIHAPHNNTIYAGMHMATGHMHSAKVAPFSDYNGTRYGIDTGCLADPNAEAFVHYTEDNPKNWRSGFGVFKFHNERLLMPQLATVFDRKHIEFQNEVIAV